MIKEEILKALRGSGDYISGQELCEKLGVSRTAVWKAVTRLKDEGYEIDSVSNRGYCLRALPDVVTEAEIGSRLRTKIMGRTCVCFDSTDSTNIQAKRLAEEGGAPWHFGLRGDADRRKGTQRQGMGFASGRGRLYEPSLRPKIRPEHASMLTLVMGLAVASACNELLARAAGGAEPVPRTGLKWPNDLVLNGKKAAGILTEMNTEIDSIHYVVIGIGINVNTRTFPEELSQATSLCQAAGKPFMRSELIALCMEYFETYDEQFEKTEDLRGLKTAYEELLVNKDVRYAYWSRETNIPGPRLE